MADQPLDVVGIGNAIVDVLSHADDGDLARHALAKGTMRLIDADEAARLYAEMGPAVECSGGSAANTMAGLASFGGRAAFVGKTRDDQLGAIFGHDLRAAGVEFETRAAADGPATAQCLIFVTPDAQRTMNTYLGACAQLGPEDIDPATIARAKVTYLEGYLWDPPAAKDAFRKAMHLAHEAGRKVALTLSDAFCVERWRGEFRDLVEREVDILFANEEEIKALYSVDDFDDAVQAARGACEITALTRSEKGSMVLTDNEIQVVDCEPVARVVDTTGAGDLYAAGFLFGLNRGEDPRTCGILGGVAAAEVISHFGARPERPLAALARARLG